MPCQGPAGKKPAAKNVKDEEDRSGPLFTFIPNAKEQRIKEEKQLKVSRAGSDFPARFWSRVLGALFTPLSSLSADFKVELHHASGRVRGAAEGADVDVLRKVAAGRALPL